MPANNRRSVLKTACVIAGCVLGAVIRYLMKSLWSSIPLLLLTTTIVAVVLGFVVVGLVLASSAGPNVRAFLVGMSGTIASISAYVGIGVSQPSWIAVAFLILTPVAVLIGLVGGGLLGVRVNSGSRSPGETGT